VGMAASTGPASLRLAFDVNALLLGSPVSIDTIHSSIAAFYSPVGTEIFAANNLNGTFTTAVPEPSTWAMLLLGFAGIGFMAYRRKTKPALMAA
jgi:hypothetical protein